MFYKQNFNIFKVNLYTTANIVFVSNNFYYCGNKRSFINSAGKFFIVFATVAFGINSFNFSNEQYVLRSAIIGQPEHYVMKGIAKNGDIYCINDDASAIMKSNPKKPGTAHYDISNGRQLTGKKHRDNPSIQGDKTLNHLDVEDGILFMYERIDW